MTDNAELRQLIAEVIDEVVSTKLGTNFEGIVQQFAVLNQVASKSAERELGDLLGLKGSDVQKASQKILGYVNNLAPHERDLYNDPNKLTELWASLNQQAGTPIANDTATEANLADKYTPEDIEAMSRDELRANDQAVVDSILARLSSEA